jgi:choline dehydrogenase
VLEGPGEHDVTQMEMLKRPSFTVIAQLLHPRARGQILLRNADPHAMPIIRHRLLDEEDVVDLTASCRTMRSIVECKPMSAQIFGEALPGPLIETDKDWADYLHAASWGAQHPVGTCRMGSDVNAVVDPSLRVRNTHNLRVADASVMPTLISGNTNAATIMIAEKASDLILRSA